MSTEQKLSERMEARTEQAEAKIRSMMWGGADADEIASTALAGGVAGRKVDQLAESVTAGKQALATASKAHDELPALNKAFSKARIAAATTETLLAQAEAANDSAQDVLHDAGLACQVAKASCSAAIVPLAQGAIDKDAAPEWLTDALAQQLAQEAAAVKAQQARQMERDISYAENELEIMKQRLARAKKEDVDKLDQNVARGGDLIPVQDVLASRIKTATKAIKQAKQELKAMKAA